MINYCRILMLMGVACFLFWYFPVAYYNVYACDDYWFGTNVNDFGFWGNQTYYWINWEGSYTHTFIDSFPHIFNCEKMPFIFNMFSISLLICAIYYAIMTFFKTTKIDSFIFACYICAILYTFTNGDSEIRFWVSANSYIIELAVVIFAISLYHSKETVTNKKYIIYMTVLLFIIAGSKITFILYMLVGITLHDVILQQKPTRLTCFTLVALFVFSLFNILAPGNLIRLNEENSVYHEHAFCFYEIFFVRMQKIMPFIGYSTLLFPVALCINVPQRITLSHVFYSILFMIIAFTLDCVIMYICFHDPGPSRVYILSEIFIIVTSLFTHLYISEYVKNQLWIKRISCTIAIIMLIVCNIPMINKIVPSIEFANLSRMRNQKIVDAENDDCVYIDPLPDSYLLLSYFANDEGWIENVYVPYFNTECEVKLKQSYE